MSENKNKNNNGWVFESNLKQKLKELSLAWILTSTSHGLPSIFRVDKIYLKIIWTILFLTSTSFCIASVWQSFDTFFSFPVSSSVKIHYESPVDFPAVTICNLNSFVKPRSVSLVNYTLASYNMTREMIIYMQNYQWKQIAQAIITDSNSNKILNESVRKYFGFSLDEILISCNYAGLPCKKTDFWWFQDPTYGNCYTYNKGLDANNNPTTLQKIGSSGPGNGLELELFVGYDERDTDFVYQSGIYALVHNQTITPLMESEGFSVATGFETNCGIKRTFSMRLDSPYSTCIRNISSPDSHSSLIYKGIFNKLKQKIYRQKVCFKLCYQQFLTQSCGCYDATIPFFSIYDNVTYESCYGIESVTCMKKFEASVQTLGDTKCDDSCPFECSSISYTNSYSIARYPTNSFSNWLAAQSDIKARYPSNITLNKQIFQDSILKLNVFYDDLYYDMIVEEPIMTISSLTANIGGQLGLFIGISLLSFGELLEISIELIRVIAVHYMQKRKIHNSANTK